MTEVTSSAGGRGGVAGRVLVVDDIHANARLVTRLLMEAAFEAIVCLEPEKVVPAVLRENPDAVLMDVRMPGRDGFSLCAELKADPLTRLVPVVLMTATADVSDRLRAIEAGADDFVTKPLQAAEVRARLRSLVRIKRYTDDLENAEQVIVSLALTIEARDTYTQGHCQRLASYAAALGEALGLDGDDVAALHRGGFLHDVGKIAVPDHILLKPSPLTPAEHRQMQEHTVIGDRLCGELRSLRRVRPIIRHHHERLDGTGYPDGLRGDAVPLLAQIIGVVDVFDALTTTRPYRRALLVDEALSELQREAARGWRSVRLVDAFAAIVRSGGVRPPERV